MLTLARSALTRGALSFVVACGSTAATPVPGATTAAPAPAATAIVDIQGFAFKPATLEIATGTRVTWTNRDGASHAIASSNKKFDSASLAKDATFSFTFTAAGTFDYQCGIHGASMSAKIVVK